MLVEDLYELTLWVQESYNTSKMSSHYSNLINTMASNIRPNTNKRPIVELKSALFKSIASTEILDLSDTQIEVLSALGVNNDFGKAGRNKIEKIFSANSSDNVTILSELKIMSQNLEKAFQWASNLKPTITSAFPEIVKSRPDDEVILRVTFKSDAAVNNFSQLENSSKQWLAIARGISMAEGKAPEEFKIIGASTGSITLIIAIGVTLGKSLAWLVKEILSATEQVLKIGLQIEELKKSKIDTQLACIELEKAQKNTLDTLPQKLLESKFENVEGADRMGDQKVAYKNSAELLIGFLKDGGDVEFKLPAPESFDDDLEEDIETALLQLHELSNGIRSIKHETTIANLPAPSQSSEEE